MFDEQFAKIRRIIERSLDDFSSGWIDILDIYIRAKDGEIDYEIKTKIKKDEH